MTVDSGEVRDRASGPRRSHMADPDLIHLWHAARPFVLVGVVATIAGGLVAAVTRPAGFAAGSWLAAYLVLVVGVAQIALGMGQAALATSPPTPRRRAIELWGWNGGAVVVVAGTLASAPALTTLGTLAVVAASWEFLVGIRVPTPHPARWFIASYRVVVLVIIVSAPVGIALAWARHG